MPLVLCPNNPVLRRTYLIKWWMDGGCVCQVDITSKYLEYRACLHKGTWKKATSVVSVCCLYVDMLFNYKDILIQN